MPCLTGLKFELGRQLEVELLEPVLVVALDAQLGAAGVDLRVRARREGAGEVSYNFV